MFGFFYASIENAIQSSRIEILELALIMLLQHYIPDDF